jgi:hypothetical protein
MPADSFVSLGNKKSAGGGGGRSADLVDWMKDVSDLDSTFCEIILPLWIWIGQVVEFGTGKVSMPSYNYLYEKNFIIRNVLFVLPHVTDWFMKAHDYEEYTNYYYTVTKVYCTDRFKLSPASSSFPASVSSHKHRDYFPLHESARVLLNREQEGWRKATVEAHLIALS